MDTQKRALKLACEQVVLFTGSCPGEYEYADLDYETRCNDETDMAECWAMYFMNRAERSKVVNTDGRCGQ